MSRRRPTPDDLNPYVALTDTALNFILLMVFFVAALTAVGRVSWEDVRYKEAQKVFQQAVERMIPARQQPRANGGKNDPPGTQRWVFRNSALFEPGRATLSRTGRVTLNQFAKVLRTNKNTWRRIRVEGHTLPTQNRSGDRWEEATDRAAAVARYLVSRGDIAPYYIATSGRGGQSPLPDTALTDPAHARIEIVLEYAKQSASDAGAP
ncbi:OmpA family protein [Deinococcus sp. SDU3-2]|uniref:OmpA family protein n=1 Tax=Deinococcus terrestris TaxID=2651870 RepID=A0A7X1TSS5_9DEIO|nr:OmpA family protein [Deinococcus terrestris]MPY67692.1 OmpA family protein [Deinococcus terrestris]